MLCEKNTLYKDLDEWDSNQNIYEAMIVEMDLIPSNFICPSRLGVLEKILAETLGTKKKKLLSAPFSQEVGVGFGISFRSTTS